MERPATSTPKMVAVSVGDCDARVCVSGDAQAPPFYMPEGGEGVVARINAGTES
jgi:hypothetical protein